jgi:hypothetical protein
MVSLHPTPAPCQWFTRLGSALDRRSAPRLALLILGAVLDRGRRTVTSWIRAAGLSDEFRLCYTAVAAARKQAEQVAARLALAAVKPLVAGVERLTLGLDDTPTDGTDRERAKSDTVSDLYPPRRLRRNGGLNHGFKVMDDRANRKLDPGRTARRR